MPFAIQMVWREQSDHVTDCYFCMTNIRGFFRKKKSKISSPVCKSAIKLLFHDPGLRIPQPPTGVAKWVKASFLRRPSSNGLGSTRTLFTLLRPWIRRFTMIISAW